MVLLLKIECLSERLTVEIIMKMGEKLIAEYIQIGDLDSIEYAINYVDSKCKNKPNFEDIKLTLRLIKEPNRPHTLSKNQLNQIYNAFKACRLGHQSHYRYCENSRWQIGRYHSFQTKDIIKLIKLIDSSDIHKSNRILYAYLQGKYDKQLELMIENQNHQISKHVFKKMKEYEYITGITAGIVGGVFDPKEEISYLSTQRIIEIQLGFIWKRHKLNLNFGGGSGSTDEEFNVYYNDSTYQNDNIDVFLVGFNYNYLIAQSKLFLFYGIGRVNAFGLDVLSPEINNKDTVISIGCALPGIGVSIDFIPIDATNLSLKGFVDYLHIDDGKIDNISSLVYSIQLEWYFTVGAYNRKMRQHYFDYFH